MLVLSWCAIVLDQTLQNIFEAELHWLIIIEVPSLTFLFLTHLVCHTSSGGRNILFLICHVTSYDNWSVGHVALWIMLRVGAYHPNSPPCRPYVSFC